MKRSIEGLEGTELKPVMPNFWAVRSVVADLIENGRAGALRWRRHGIGLIQAYVFGGGDDFESRLHIWHPALVREGIEDHGDIHDHRFDLQSTVLYGYILHEEATVTENLEGAYTVHQVTHARQNPTGEFREAVMDVVPGPLAPTAERVDVKLTPLTILAGDTYTFKRGYFHRTRTDGLAVTLVTKTNQIDKGARILARGDRPPTPAFDPRDTEDPALAGLILEVIHDAAKHLRRVA